MEGRGIELIEHEDHHPGEQNKELHGNLQQTIEQKSQLTLPNGTPGQITLYLALVCTEVGECQETTPYDSTPESVAIIEVKTEVQYVQFSTLPGDLQGFGEIDVQGQVIEYQQECGKHTGEDHGHLLFLSDAHSLGTPANGIDDHQQADPDIEQGQVPTQYCRKDDGRCKDGDPCGQAPLNKKEYGR